MSSTINIFSEAVIYLWPELPEEAYDPQGWYPGGHESHETEKQPSEGEYSTTSEGTNIF
jgi:hypothetical protein